ncbi:MAG: RimJ/RimL family protein N-acetyltransferase [Saprospiraceae bacterium]|jgi:RimJ/RimL family protein N-acetyltransferase
MNFNFRNDIILENDRVLIRPMEAADKEHLMPVLIDPTLSKYSVEMINGEEGVFHYIDKCLGDRKNKIRYPFTFFDKKANAYAGTSCFGDITNAHKRVEIGWTKLAKPFQGTGLNAHCKFLLFQYAFDTLAFNRVALKAHSKNIQSRKAMAKIGATYEGTLRNHFMLYDGTLRDTVYYSVLSEEWAGVKIGLLKLMTQD